MKNPYNPRGVRTVTIIVTHEDASSDFSRTYTASQILREGVGFTEDYETGKRHWQMTTTEGRDS